MPKKGTDGKYHSKVVPAKGAKPIYFSAKTLKEFNEKRQQIIDEYRSGGLSSKKKTITFSEFTKEWWETIKSPRITKHSTRGQYETCLKLRVYPFFNKKAVQAVTYSDLQKCVDQTRGKSKSTAKAVMTILRQVCTYAVKERVMPYNYSLGLEMPVTYEKIKRLPLTANQAKAFRELFKSYPHYAILYYTGVRLGELLGLQWKDIDFVKRRVQIRQAAKAGTDSLSEGMIGKTKTAAGERFIPMPDELFDILYPIRGLPEQFIVKGRRGVVLRRTTFRRAWKASVCVNPLLTEITPHWLRHNYAAGLYLAGVPGQVSCVWLGHENPSITLNLYTHVKHILEKYDHPDTHLSEALKKVAEKLRNESKVYENIL